MSPSASSNTPGEDAGEGEEVGGGGEVGGWGGPDTDRVEERGVLGGEGGGAGHLWQMSRSGD